jgi:antitoxin MazE
MKPFRHKTLEERAAEFDGRLDLDGKLDWGEPIGRKKWE